MQNWVPVLATALSTATSSLPSPLGSSTGNAEEMLCFFYQLNLLSIWGIGISSEPDRHKSPDDGLVWELMSLSGFGVFDWVLLRCWEALQGNDLWD